jgi:hypothetical protein
MAARLYELRYRISHPTRLDGELRKWWRDEHVQEERMTVASANRDDAWYVLLLHHDTWERLPPRIERLSAMRRGRRRSGRKSSRRRGKTRRR